MARYSQTLNNPLAAHAQLEACANSVYRQHVLPENSAHLAQAMELSAKTADKTKSQWLPICSQITNVLNVLQLNFVLVAYKLETASLVIIASKEQIHLLLT